MTSFLSDGIYYNYMQLTNFENWVLMSFREELLLGQPKHSLLRIWQHQWIGRTVGRERIMSRLVSKRKQKVIILSLTLDLTSYLSD